MNFGDMTLIYTSKFFHPFSHTFDSSVKFVGPSILPRPEVPEFPYDQLTGDRLIYISLGTLFTNHLEFFRACVEAFGNSKYQVVMSIGRNVALSDLGPLPSNFIVRDFVPQLEILQRAALFITHGGMNSASEGMYYGVPLIVIPQAQDQFYVAKRVTRLKAGKMLLMKIALSIYGSAIPFAAIAGQVGAGLLLQANILGLIWRPLFLINVPLGIVTLAAAAILLERRSTITHTRLDTGGVALVTTALLLLIVPLVIGREAGWPWWMLLMLIASLPAFLLFALFEQRLTERGGAPLVNLALFRQRAFTVGNLIALGFFGCNAGMSFVLTVSLQIGLGFSPLHYGLTYACMAISTFVATTLLSRLTPRFGQYLVSLGSFTQAIGLFVMLALVLYAWARNNVSVVSSWTLTPIFLILGFGAGLGIAPLVGAIISRVRSQDAGTASGVLTTVMQTSNALGVAVVGLYFFTALGLLPGTDPQPIRYLLAFGWTLPFLAALALVSGAMVWLLPAQKQEITS